MTIYACVLGVTHNLPMRREWKEWNECTCGTAQTRNAGCASTMNATSVLAVVAGFALVVAVPFVGRSFGYVRLVCWCGVTSVASKRRRVVLSVGMCGKTETLFCVLLVKRSLDEDVGVHGLVERGGAMSMGSSSRKESRQALLCPLWITRRTWCALLMLTSGPPWK